MALMSALDEVMGSETGCLEGGHNEGLPMLSVENEQCILNMGLYLHLGNMPLESW